MNKKILVLVGPSGSGKTTIGKCLTKKGIKKLVTTTTRPPRLGEKDGVDYYFRQTNELNLDEFIEQTKYNKHIYGLTHAEVANALKQYDTVHVALDRNGSKVMKQVFPQESIVIFVSITEEQMMNRMKSRGESCLVIEERLAHCREQGELLPPPETDLVVENQDVEQAVNQIINKV